jgi:hypothetical protein
VVTVSDCYCLSRNSPGFDSSILRHGGIWGAADEAVLKKAHYKNPNEFPLFIYSFWAFPRTSIGGFESFTCCWWLVCMYRCLVYVFLICPRMTNIISNLSRYRTERFIDIGRRKCCWYSWIQKHNTANYWLILRSPCFFRICVRGPLSAAKWLVYHGNRQ